MITGTLLKVQYRGARLPFTLVQSQLMPRISHDSRSRLVFERVLGSFDMMAGRLLGDEQLMTCGARLMARADALGEAVRLEADAAGRKQAAAQTRQRAAQQADELRAQAEQQQLDGVRQTGTRTREAKREASDRVQTQAEKAKRQAQSRAAGKLAAAHDDQQAAERTAAARKQRAATTASDTISVAAAEKEHARTRRADAGQLSELADAKNNARKHS